MDEERRETSGKVELRFRATNKEMTGESDEVLVGAKKEYEEIWERDGVEIIRAMEEVSGFKFRERSVEVKVWSGKTYSGRPFASPLMLGARTPGNRRAILVHELLHRLHDDYGLEVDGKGDKEISENNHRTLYLNLRDVWERVYGEEFAQKSVEEEGKNQLVVSYSDIWRETLDRFPTRELRQKEFERLKNQAV